MRKRLLAMLLSLVMLSALCVPAMADDAKAAATNQAITVDGKTAEPEVYNIDGSNFFKLRDVAKLLDGTDSQFSVTYDDAARTVSATSGESYTPVGGELTRGSDSSSTCVKSTQTISVNGITREIDAYNIGGSNFFRLSDLGDLLGFGVSYDEASRTVVVDSTDALSFSNATSTVLRPHLDGKEISVTMYEDCYTRYPNRLADQKISIYVPENATAASPIIFLVNNAGWQADSYDGRTQVKSYGTETQTDRRSGETKEVTVGDYMSRSDTDAIGRALSEGYVIVSYGGRSRGDGETDGKYLGHSPATMTDTKAAIRYLKYNSKLLPAGNTDRIVITGTSGGGALSTVIAASGNSEGFYESLYEIGAAGISYKDGKYTDSLSDGVYSVIAYCPITDLGHDDAAYEWTYGDVRQQLYSEGLMSYKGADEKTVLENSKTLKDSYPEYVASLGLKTEDGKPLTAELLDETIQSLMKKEIDLTVKELGVEKMKADIAANKYSSDDWLKLNDDGTYTYDYDRHLYYVARNTTLKISCAFSNFGTGYGEMMNEDNLFGTTAQAYSPFEFLSWKLDATKDNGVGYDDTGLEWDDFMKTDDGKALAKQIRMASAVDYLADKADGDTAPYWYVRHGMADRDTSFAVVALLYLSIINDADILDANFGFAWLKPHSGDYDVNEAYDWLKTIL